jgi:fatty acid desaturase
MTSVHMSAEPLPTPAPLEDARAWPPPVSPDELKQALLAAHAPPGGPLSFIALAACAALCTACAALLLLDHLLAAAILLIPTNLALALLLHECAHASLLPWRRAHAPLGALLGVLALSPFSSYRRGHIAHHRFTGDPARDPTVSPQHTRAPSLALELAYRLRLPVFYWGGVFLPYLCYDLRAPRSPRRILSWSASIAASITWIAALVLATGPRALLPLAVGFLGASVLYEHLFTMHQHIGLASDPEHHAPRHQLAWTRSVPLPASWLLLHFNLHKEHHLAPGLPWHRLPHLHRTLSAMRPDLYTFTRQDHALLWRRDTSAAQRLAPHRGDSTTR